MRLIVLVTCFNCEHLIEKTIKSIRSQTYTKFKCFITDDLSTDNSVAVIKDLIKSDERFTLIVNKEKLSQCGNYDLICRNTERIKNDDICVEIDGDGDSLIDENVFNKVIEAYSDNKTWITNGSFKFISGANGFSAEIKDFDNLRNLPFTASHLRTWKVFLWRALKQEDLKDENGNWIKVGGDLFFFLPMLEMAGKYFYQFFSDITYIYNDLNPLNDSKLYMKEVDRMVELIKIKEKYKPLNVKINRNGEFKKYL